MQAAAGVGRARALAFFWLVTYRIHLQLQAGDVDFFEGNFEVGAAVQAAQVLQAGDADINERSSVFQLMGMSSHSKAFLRGLGDHRGLEFLPIPPPHHRSQQFATTVIDSGLDEISFERHCVINDRPYIRR